MNRDLDPGLFLDWHAAQQQARERADEPYELDDRLAREDRERDHWPAAQAFPGHP